jgi:hypothetical protein
MSQAHVDQTKVAVQERCETNRVRLTDQCKQCEYTSSPIAKGEHYEKAIKR